MTFAHEDPAVACEFCFSVVFSAMLMDLHGVGPAVAARVLADVGDVTRFADRNRFASWTGTAPLDASSGESRSATGSPAPGTGG